MRAFASNLSITIICLTVSLTCQALDTNQLIKPDQVKSFHQAHGKKAKLRLSAWLSLIKSGKGKSTAQKLKLVNDFFNQFQFRSDQKFIGQADYWMTPLEFIAKGAGDCEDFSIAKYFTLIAMGIPQEKLRITYVKALKLNQAHMILAYYKEPSSDPLVLDNLMAKIKKASLRKDLTPVYSFNTNGLWLNKLGQNNKVGSAKRLSKWQTLLERMRQQRKSK